MENLGEIAATIGYALAALGFLLLTGLLLTSLRQRIRSMILAGAVAVTGLRAASFATEAVISLLTAVQMCREQRRRLP